MGNNATRACHGPGTLWTPGTDPKAPSPDCGYIYRYSSAGAAGGAYTVTVTVTWEVTWTGAGQSGTVPGLETTGQVQTSTPCRLRSLLRPPAHSAMRADHA